MSTRRTAAFAAVLSSAFVSRTAAFNHASARPASTSMDASRERSTVDGDGVGVRILCLHGKGGNGDEFIKSALQPLRLVLEQRASTTNDGGVKVSFQWEALTAPYALRPGDETAGYSWWTMPPGVRSYNAKEFEGFEQSAAMVMDEVFPDDTACEFDIILGHSQGAILTAALLSIQDRLRNPSRGPLGYILNGVAWPNPYQNNLLSLADQCDAIDASPRMAFILGKNDNINPTESARQVYEAYQKANFDVSIVNHDGGHSVPLGRDQDSVQALEEVAEWIMDVAKEKARRLNDAPDS